MLEELRDSNTKQLYSLLRKSIRTFASGYCYALIDTQAHLTHTHANQLLMNHVERCFAILTELLGIEWNVDELSTIQMDVTEVCLEKLHPF